MADDDDRNPLKLWPLSSIRYRLRIFGTSNFSTSQVSSLLLLI